MSKWTHNICGGCWNRLNPDREPFAALQPFAETDKCCFCGKDNHDGIFVRRAPEETICRGECENG